jgi:hypothetical protein
MRTLRIALHFGVKKALLVALHRALPIGTPTLACIAVIVRHSPKRVLRRPRATVRAAYNAALLANRLLNEHGGLGLDQATQREIALIGDAFSNRRWDRVRPETLEIVSNMLALHLPSTAPICSAPGWLLHRLCAWVFPRRTFVEVLEPVLSDMQYEFSEALRDKRPIKARWVQVRGYAAFTLTCVLQLPLTLIRLFLGIWRGL